MDGPVSISGEPTQQPPSARFGRCAAPRGDHRQEPFCPRPTPLAATSGRSCGNRKGIEKEHIFAPASASEHPRQIPPEDLDEVFGEVPAGEQNEPLDIYYPLYEESFPDTEAEEPDDEDETEELPLLGRSLAQGVSFEQMGEVYRHVVHDPPITDYQKEETGRLLLGLKETDMFEAIVSGCPDGNDRVKNLIDTYLSAFHRRMGRRGLRKAPLRRVSFPRDSTFVIMSNREKQNDMKERDYG